MIHRINLLTLDEPVRSPLAIVHSTNPRRAEGEDEVPYFAKVPDPEVAFAELAGCALAKEVGLTVPNVVAAEFAGQTYAGIRKVEGDRDIGHWLGRSQRVSNFLELFDAVVVDVWLGS